MYITMMTGHIYRTFKAKDGRKVVLRALKFEDLDDLLKNINSLVEEGVDILMDEKMTREAEADWLARQLVAQEKGEVIYIAAEVDNKIIANSEIHRFSRKKQAHKGELGIAITSGYRGIGIGTEMIRTLIDESRRIGLKLLLLYVFETNKIARHIYEKLGFKEVGRVPKGIFRGGKYIDEIIMALFI
jgi:RimJ/RimL family protein N-acetyltransferase